MDLNMKVLIVDDFATMRRILRNILKQIGFKNIIEADEGIWRLIFGFLTGTYYYCYNNVFFLKRRPCNAE